MAKSKKAAKSKIQPRKSSSVKRANAAKGGRVYVSAYTRSKPAK
jgi:hypothetical protein